MQTQVSINNQSFNEQTFISAALNLNSIRQQESVLPRWMSCVWSSRSPEKVEFKYFAKAGMLSQAQGELDMAEEFFESALALAEELYGEAHYRTGLVTLYLAKVSRMKGKRAEAALLRDRAQSILSTNKVEPAAGGSSGFWSLLFSH